MNFDEYQELSFPVTLVTLCRYEAGNIKLKCGDTFIGVRREKIGINDYSVIDSNGHPHHYSGCDKLMKDDK